MRKSLYPFTILAVAIALVATGFLVAGNKGPSGKELFRGYCKPCHLADSPNGQVQPLTLIQDQWTRFFDKEFVESHQDVEAPDDSGKKLLEVLDEDMIKQIRKFAIDHAADSESPMTCG